MGGQVFFLWDLRFHPTYRLTRLKMSEIILTGRKTQIKKKKKKDTKYLDRHSLCKQCRPRSEGFLKKLPYSQAECGFPFPTYGPRKVWTCADTLVVILLIKWNLPRYLQIVFPTVLHFSWRVPESCSWMSSHSHTELPWSLLSRDIKDITLNDELWEIDKIWGSAEFLNLGPECLLTLILNCLDLCCLGI